MTIGLKTDGALRQPGRRTVLEPESVAIEALGFLAEDPERLGRFLALTGLDPAGLRAAAGRPGFARAILAYLAEDETLLLAFAAARGYPPEAVGALVRGAVEQEEG